MFGHFLADFVLQTNFINAWKRSSRWGMLAHCGIHPVCYLALTCPYINDVWVSNPFFELQGWACLLLIFVAHYLEDVWRVFTIFKYHTPDNTLYFLWDQVIHYTAIFIMSPVEASGAAAAAVPEAWPVIGVLLIMATFFCTIFIYFLEKDLRDKKFPTWREKYLGMSERLALVLCFFLPSPWRLGAVLTVAALMALLRIKKIPYFSWFSYYAGGGLAAACGFAARCVLASS